MKTLFLFLTMLFAGSLTAQINTMCGNGDFESGLIDPAEWTGYYRDTNPTWNCTDIQSFSTGISGGAINVLAAHHTVVPNTVDPTIGTLQTVPPFPVINNYSLRLGNKATMRGDEKLVKEFLVQPGQTKLKYWFASVMQDPGNGHDCGTDIGALRPGFGINIFDSFGTDYSFLVDLGNNSNFLPFTPGSPLFNGPFSGVYHTAWDCREINLDTLIGQVITVEFYNRDCFGIAHYGYTYVDNICLGCSGGASGSIDLDMEADTCGLPGQICINYTLPNTGNLTGDIQLDLNILQNGVPLILFSSPVLTSGNQYCFDLNTTNLTTLNTGLGGFDFMVTGHFSITDALGNTTVLPDKTIGSQPEGTVLGQNNDYLFSCRNTCEKLTVQDSMLTSNQCCYAIDLTNAYGPNVAYVEATVISTDWVFATGATTGSGFSWFGTPGPNSLPITVFTPTGTPNVPVGISNDALIFCFEPTTTTPTLPQTVVFTWYITTPNIPGYTPVCQDTLTFDCVPEQQTNCLTMEPVVTCNPNNPYEYIVDFTVTNNTSFLATHLLLDNLANPLDYGFSACTANDHLSSIAIPLSPPLGPGATSGPLCVKIHTTNPVFGSVPFQFFVGLSTPEECCTNEIQEQITLTPCCDPCADIQLVVNPLEDANAKCCYNLDIENNCAYRFFTKVETNILTPGVEFGYHALGGPNAPDWNIGASTTTSILWEMNSNNYIPAGITMDLIQFCLDDINLPSEAPQFVQVNWITEDLFGQDSIACSDTLQFNCAPVVDYECLEVTNQVLECIPDSNLYCYTFTVTNTSDIPFAATNLDLFELSDANIEFTGGGGTFPLPPLNYQDSIRLSVCMVADTFPLTDSLLVFQYRLRYLMGDTCCYESLRDTLAIPNCFPSEMLDCCYPAFINMPTGLSPNGDSQNDVYVIQGIDNCKHVTLTVFNRWGNIVYKMDDYDNSWGGTNQDGTTLAQGTYYILLTLHDSGSSMAGFVDLRRQ
ncbi:MAG: hypothetical protein DHS20C18_48660 [Saprospiraceae bacterium]|nr:MAG: hypothetical protein DHS20C18_48660 [Saprospiraceae bacterium]